jgi:hypothetical protein
VNHQSGDLGPVTWVCSLVQPARLGLPLPMAGPEAAFPSLLTRQWLRCSPSGDVRVDGYVAARAELGACSVGAASPAPGLARGACPRESPCSATSRRAWQWQAGVG